VIAKAGYADEPKKGGTLNIGIAGGSTTDSLDPTTYTEFDGVRHRLHDHDQLIETDPNNKQIPSLFKSWEASEAPPSGCSRSRKRPSTMASHGRRDIVYSINLHRGEGSKSGGAEG